MTASCTLADLIVSAAAEAWRDAGEVIATGIGPLPRLAASLAKASFAPALLMTDSEAHYVTEPVPPGPRRAAPCFEGWAPYDRIFSTLWGGRRHAMVTPVQIDRFGQANISVIGEHARPKAAMLGARGFPGNSVSHPNSFFIPAHSRRVFVPGEVDFVCSAGYNPARYADGRFPPGLDLRLIVTDLAVMDFGGPGHAVRLVSTHPGVSVEAVRDATGFDLCVPEGGVAETALPDAATLALIASLDPNGVRNGIFKGNPPADRRAAESAA